tara:strand:+ start:29665 stop:30717 length:1053 start_codon:yes stop_codon:yes gene_type:complete
MSDDTKSYVSELNEFRERHDQLRAQLKAAIREFHDVQSEATNSLHDTRRSAKDEFERQKAEAQVAFENLIETAEAEYQQLLADAEAAYETKMDALQPELLDVLPLTRDQDRQPPTRRAAYSDRMALIMAKLAMLAYQKFETDEHVQDILELKLAQGGLKLIGDFSTEGGTQGYVCEHPDFAALAFRGTDHWQDWKINTNSQRVVIKDNSLRIQAHRGFLEAYLDAEPQILDYLREIGDKPLYITGHSLGGALAVVASASLPMEASIYNDQIASVYTFGSPRVGGGDFNRLVKAPHYRIYNPGDMVPSAPPFWLSFQHTGDLRYLKYTDRPPAKRSPVFGLFLLSLWSLWG